LKKKEEIDRIKDIWVKERFDMK